jgi:branched-chain amino acid transport system permease protein
MSIVLQNYVQIAQGARVKPLPPLIEGGHTLMSSEDFPSAFQCPDHRGYDDARLLVVFTWVVAKTRLGRDMRACEQDLRMASLLGINIDRTISLTFVIGAALAAVAGIMYLLATA